MVVEVRRKAEEAVSEVILESISSMLYARIFHTKYLAAKISKLCFGFDILAPKILYKICAHKTLMKLTPAEDSIYQHFKNTFLYKSFLRSFSVITERVFSFLIFVKSKLGQCKSCL